MGNKRKALEKIPGWFWSGSIKKTNSGSKTSKPKKNKVEQEK